MQHPQLPPPPPSVTININISVDASSLQAVDTRAFILNFGAPELVESIAAALKLAVPLPVPLPVPVPEIPQPVPPPAAPVISPVPSPPESPPSLSIPPPVQSEEEGVVSRAEQSYVFPPGTYKPCEARRSTCLSGCPREERSRSKIVRLVYLTRGELYDPKAGPVSGVLIKSKVQQYICDYRLPPGFDCAIFDKIRDFAWNAEYILVNARSFLVSGDWHPDNADSTPHVLTYLKRAIAGALENPVQIDQLPKCYCTTCLRKLESHATCHIVAPPGEEKEKKEHESALPKPLSLPSPWS